MERLYKLKSVLLSVFFLLSFVSLSFGTVFPVVDGQNWQEPFSHVSANTDAGQSIPNASNTVVILGTEEWDELSEYNTTTGVFTAKYSGKYLVNAQVVFGAASWGTTEFVLLYVYKNSATYKRSIRQECRESGTFYMGTSVSCSVDLAAGDTIDIRVYQNQGGAVSLDTQAQYNYLTIDRLK